MNDDIRLRGNIVRGPASQLVADFEQDRPGLKGVRICQDGFPKCSADMPEQQEQGIGKHLFDGSQHRDTLPDAHVYDASVFVALMEMMTS